MRRINRAKKPITRKGKSCEDRAKILMLLVDYRAALCINEAPPCDGASRYLCAASPLSSHWRRLYVASSKGELFANLEVQLKLYASPTLRGKVKCEHNAPNSPREEIHHKKKELLRRSRENIDASACKSSRPLHK